MKKHRLLMVCLSFLLALGLVGLAAAASAAAKRKPAVQEEEVQAPAPEVIPEAAKRYLAQGLAIMERAQSPQDYEEAVRALERAVGLAPQWRAAYYDLAQAQEAAEKYSEAIKSLRKYLALTPPGEDVESIKIWIYKLEEKMKYLAGPGADVKLAQQLGGTWIDVKDPLYHWEFEGTGPKVRGGYYYDHPDLPPEFPRPHLFFDAVVEKGRLIGTITSIIPNNKWGPSPLNMAINVSPDGRYLTLYKTDGPELLRRK